MGRYLEALKQLYGGDEKSIETPKPRTDKADKRAFVSNVGSSSEDFQENSPGKESIPFTDQEIAEHKISQLDLHNDRVFVRRMLIGVYGKERLDMVEQYFDEWNRGKDAVTAAHRREGEGRKRANNWLRELREVRKFEKHAR